ncbi:exopolysaccharide biosynthesis polyprenyl glycosylphosphotransferase [Alsobacter sp. SYSU BS001988]|jgi:exopolysaccharide biosynthesis polyprenyl glycosylphosphotransferase
MSEQIQPVFSPTPFRSRTETARYVRSSHSFSAETPAKYWDLPRARSRFGARAAKRALDLAIATLGLAVLWPLFLVIALAIKLDSPGPIFFRQRRHGLDHATFRILKFRTMTTMDEAGHGPQAARHDPRVTRLGRHLRRFSIDELPQLINVISGEMSLVGPRPHAVAHNYLYEAQLPGYARRHSVKPGITGWAQVHGLRGETDTLDKMRARVERDLEYVEIWSLRLDLKILALTLFSLRPYRNAF